MMACFRLHALLGLSLSLALHPAAADWAGFSRYGAVAEISIEADHIHLDLRVLDSALPHLAQLAAFPNPMPSWERVAPALLMFKDAAGHTLTARPTGTPIAHPAENGVPAFHEIGLDYPLPPAARTLGLAPIAGTVAYDLGIIALHRGVPVNDLAPLAQTETLRLDPVDPWRSRFDNAGFARGHAEPRSYLYVEPYEVRHELLLRWADLAGPLGLEPGAIPPIAALPGLKQKIGALLAAHNPLQIDGAAIAPQIDRVEFVHYTRQGVQPVAEGTGLDPATALVGAMLSYLTERPAQQIALDWDLFGPGLQHRPVSAIQGRESFDGELTPGQPRFEWSRADALEPTPSADTDPAPAAVGRANQAPAAETLAALLHNAYRAFALRGEEAAYDRLAKSLDGELLADIYLQQRRALLRQTDGLGGEGRVDRIELLQSDIQAVPGGGYVADARWIAHGTVSHWGHGHERHNLYSARLSLNPGADGGWKITALDFQGGQRLDAGAGS
ncbi:hypothetical protein SAMN02949497_0470 [Methylomagnum ishizawai]|uniref:DUF4440 domain-containing protein n=1 Tax=Methylomagnum ishizawai TaxID=1760988 RepID=A0A1Y6D4B8_9GAMM|nr:hypothetical protein [Methylomagnum ishizawai]SMF97441.1 hypothetical protein SAMN02949497_0470 [Methylomagnum ishizawai]